MNYERLQLIGRGGITEVYQARHLGSGSLFAIKFLKDEFCGNDEIVERFVREMKICRRLEHPNIVRIHDLGRDKQPYLGINKQPYAVLELLQGQTLKERLRSEPLAATEAKAIAEQVVVALGEAHRMGVVHRNIEPGNVFLCQDGPVKVMDFGMARVAGYVAAIQPDSQFGAAEYMSPEQIKGNVITERSDLYSLGIVLYHMLMGSVPFEAESREAMMRKHLEEPLPPLPERISPQLRNVLGKMLQKDPSARFSAAHHVWEALKPHEVPDSLYNKPKRPGTLQPVSSAPAAQARSEHPIPPAGEHSIPPAAGNGADAVVDVPAVSKAPAASTHFSGISRKDIFEEPAGWAARRRRSSPARVEEQRPAATQPARVTSPERESPVATISAAAPINAAAPIAPATAVTAPMPPSSHTAPPAAPIPSSVAGPVDAPMGAAMPPAPVAPVTPKSNVSARKKSRMEMKPADPWIKTTLQTAGVVVLCGAAFVLLLRIAQTPGTSSGTRPAAGRVSTTGRMATGPVGAMAPGNENSPHPAQAAATAARLKELSRPETRVTRELQTIAHDTETRRTTSLPPGARRVLRNGRAGARRVTVEATYQEGRATSRRAIGSRVVRSPVSEVVLIGAQPGSEPERSRKPGEKATSESQPKPQLAPETRSLNTGLNVQAKPERTAGLAPQPAPEPQPGVNSQPGVNPQAAAKPEPGVRPQPAPRLEARVETSPSPRPRPEPQPMRSSRPALDPESETSPRPRPEPERPY